MSRFTEESGKTVKTDRSCGRCFMPLKDFVYPLLYDPNSYYPDSDYCEACGDSISRECGLQQSIEKIVELAQR
jgi:hypothetical protein